MSTLRRLVEALSDKRHRDREDTIASALVFCACTTAASSVFVPDAVDDMIALSAGAIIMITVVGWVITKLIRYR